ncbi:hypothetical protein JYA63_02190 [Fictibacillus nanhaiensis]|uniref:Uncharacterized protein n=1 Tax=Fictibacillus nanhaiensis TaxID=742169 RepID=A0ABS2ZKQ4_9BACL|nr:hypothetical protein [Fictibacillus nanhaiensis]
MITIKSLPDHILNIAKGFQENNKQIHVFPSLLDIEGDRYFYFRFSPKRGQLIVREDGAVLPINQVKKAFVYGLVYNTSFENITKFGLKWVESGTLQRYQKLCRILTKLSSTIHQQAPQEVINSLTNFKECADEIIKEQKNIEFVVGKSFELASKTNDLELVTMDDCIQMRIYNESMVRSAFRQNEVQLETEEDRARVFKYIWTKKFSYNLKLLPIFVQLFPYKNHMRTSQTIGSDEMESIKIMISKDLIIEQSEDALAALNTLRNPSN